MANIAITNYCNLRCPYCFADDFIQENKQEITIEQLNRILAFIGSEKTRIGIIGGEPTLHSDFTKIIKKINDFAETNSMHIVLFTNGIELNKVLSYIGPNFNCLINLNEPEVVGMSNWKKIIYNLERVKALNKLDYITLGINLYPGIKNFDYILDVAKKYFKGQIRLSITAPSCQFTKIDKDTYYNEAKIRFLDFLEKAKEYQIKIKLDCNHIPECYFDENKLLEIKKYVIGWHKVCRPVIDISPDFYGTACFGAYDPVDLSQFENIAEAKEYFKNEKLKVLQQKNNGGSCAQCEEFKAGNCQGGCLAFAKHNN